MAVIYIDEEKGLDAQDGGSGTEASPLKNLQEAYITHGPDNDFQVKKKGEDEFKPAAKSALKKAANFAEQQRKKQRLLPNEQRKKHRRKPLERLHWRLLKTSRSPRMTLFPRLSLSNYLTLIPSLLDSFARALTSLRRE